jgi:hypothetical protein
MLSKKELGKRKCMSLLEQEEMIWNLAGGILWCNGRRVGYEKT